MPVLRVLAQRLGHKLVREQTLLHGGPLRAGILQERLDGGRDAGRGLREVLHEAMVLGQERKVATLGIEDILKGGQVVMKLLPVKDIRGRCHEAHVGGMPGTELLHNGDDIVRHALRGGARACWKLFAQQVLRLPVPCRSSGPCESSLPLAASRHQRSRSQKKPRS